jgi:hypothetical protein
MDHEKEKYVVEVEKVEEVDGYGSGKEVVEVQNHSNMPPFV